MAATALVTLLGVARDVLIANRLGLGTATDAYALAFGLANALGMAMTSATMLFAVAVIAQLQAAGHSRFISRIVPCLWGSLGTAGVISVALYLSGKLAPDLLFVRTMDGDERVLVSRLLQVVAWIPLGATVAAVFSVRARFLGYHGRATGIGCLRSGGAMVVLLAVPSLGIVAAGLGWMAGLGLEVILLGVWTWGLRSHGQDPTAPREQPAAPEGGDPPPGARASVWPAFVATLVPAAALLTDKLVVSQGRAGEPAALEFAYKLVSAPHGLLAMSLVTVAYVEISRTVATRNEAGTKSVVRAAVMTIVVMTGLVSGFLAITAPAVVKLVYGHGAVRPQDLTVLVDCFLWYLVGLVPAGLGALIVRMCFLLGEQRRVAAWGLALIGVNALLDVAVYPVLGLAGVAAVTSLLNVAWVVLLARRSSAGPLFRDTRAEFARHFGSLTVVFVGTLAPVYVTYWLVMRSWGGDTWLQQVIPLTAAAILFLVLSAVWSRHLGLWREMAGLLGGGTR